MQVKKYIHFVALPNQRCLGFVSMDFLDFVQLETCLNYSTPILIVYIPGDHKFGLGRLSAAGGGGETHFTKFFISFRFFHRFTLNFVNMPLKI